MSTKRKLPVFSVGAFLLLGLSVLGWMMIKYGGAKGGQEGYNIELLFSDASGIIEGGIVRLAGANVGSVVSTPELTENHQVSVIVAIREDLKLPLNAQFEIVSLSFLGDKAIYVKMPSNPNPILLKDGDQVLGVSSKGIDAIQAQAEDIVIKSNITLDKINSALDQYSLVAKELNTSLSRLNSSIFQKGNLERMGLAIENVERTTQSFKEISGSLHPLTEDVRVTMKEFRKVAKTANSTVEKSQSTIDNLNERIALLDPALKKLPKTIETYSEIGEILEKSLNNENGLLSAVTKDSEVKDDAKTFVKNLRTNGILGYKDDSDIENDDPRDRYRGLRR